METIDQRLFDVTVDVSDDTYFRFSVNDVRYQIRWTQMSPPLAAATAAERAVVDVSPSGYGIHWPLLDEDLAVEPLVAHAERIDRN